MTTLKTIPQTIPPICTGRFRTALWSWNAKEGNFRLLSRENKFEEQETFLTCYNALQDPSWAECVEVGVIKFLPLDCKWFSRLNYFAGSSFDSRMLCALLLRHSYETDQSYLTIFISSHPLPPYFENYFQHFSFVMNLSSGKRNYYQNSLHLGSFPPLQPEEMLILSGMTQERLLQWKKYQKEFNYWIHVSLDYCFIPELIEMIVDFLDVSISVRNWKNAVHWFSTKETL